MNYKIVITDLEHATIDPELEVLAAIQAEVEWHDCRTEEDVIRVGAGADALMIGFAPITGRVLEALPQCGIVCRYGIGVEMIDVDAATQHGVIATNVPDFCLDEVADHAMALLLASARKIVFLDKAVRSGEAAGDGHWLTAEIANPMYRLSKQTLGIIGLGKTGQGVARRAQAFGLRVIAAPDRAVSPEEAAALNVSVLPLDEVLSQADFLTLHVPLTKETHHLVNAEKLALMKPSATIINTSRGPVIDEAALIDALREQRLAQCCPGRVRAGTYRCGQPPARDGQRGAVLPRSLVFGRCVSRAESQDSSGGRGLFSGPGAALRAQSIRPVIPQPAKAARRRNMSVCLKYGKGSLDLELGDAAERVLFLEPRPAEARQDEMTLIRNALANR